MSDPHTGFRDPTDLTRTTKGFLYANIPLILVAVAANARANWWLSNRGEAAPPLAHVQVGDRVVVDPMPLLESLVGLVASLTALLLVVTSVSVLMWIHRANYNARQLGATGMKFTPGWAVGWYFIPIASIWKPYQAMKEICQASFNPRRWWDEERPALLPAWWALWLLATGAEGVSWSVSTEAAESASDLVRQLLAIPLILILVSIINQVHRMQMANYRTQSDR